MTKSAPALAKRNVGAIAADLPGATGVFRRHGIDFCCHGDIPLEEAAHARGLDLAAIEQSLAALDPAAAPAAPQATDALIAHIQSRYHATHRQQIPELLELARRVEAVHARHPKAPAGLADALQAIWGKLEVHMKREELLVFPAMRRQAAGDLSAKIGDLRHDHGDHAAFLASVAKITDDYTLPEGACRSWQALYAGAAQLRSDLMEHIHLENNVLFPRFETAA